MPSTSTDRSVDVVIVGDGPAGCSLAVSSRRRDVDVVLVGPDEPWERTYGTWVDDLDDAEAFTATDTATLFSSILSTIAVHTTRSQDLDRAYGVFDNQVLRSRLRDGIEHLTATATDVRTGTGGHHVVKLSDGSQLLARVVIDTTGWPSSFARRAQGSAPAWQTAMGVVLDSPPPGDLGRAASTVSSTSQPS
jgi:lycopene cyclase-like protein